MDNLPEHAAPRHYETYDLDGTTKHYFKDDTVLDSYAARDAQIKALGYDPLNKPNMEGEEASDWGLDDTKTVPEIKKEDKRTPLEKVKDLKARLLKREKALEPLAQYTYGPLYMRSKGEEWDDTPVKIEPKPEPILPPTRSYQPTYTESGTQKNYISGMKI